MEQRNYFIPIYRFKINLKNKKECKIIGNMKKIASNNKSRKTLKISTYPAHSGP